MSSVSITSFVPSALAPFQFQVTLDGQLYTVIVTWSLFGQRYYMNLFDLSGNLILSRSIVGSPVGIALQGLIWDQGVVTAQTTESHGFDDGQTLILTISRAIPDAYNGTYQCLVNGNDTFTYSLAGDPGPATAFGEFDYYIDLTKGYFESILAFQDENQQFIVVTP